MKVRSVASSLQALMPLLTHSLMLLLPESKLSDIHYSPHNASYVCLCILHIHRDSWESLLRTPPAASAAESTVTWSCSGVGADHNNAISGILLNHGQYQLRITAHYYYYNRLPLWLNPYAADVTFVQCTKKQKIMKIISNLSCWYSLESSH